MYFSRVNVGLQEAVRKFMNGEDHTESIEEEPKQPGCCKQACGRCLKWWCCRSIAKFFLYTFVGLGVFALIGFFVGEQP